MLAARNLVAGPVLSAGRPVGGAGGGPRRACFLRCLWGQ